VDDALVNFESHGALPLPVADFEGYIEPRGIRLWHAYYGAPTGPGPVVVLLHGGLGHSGNWGYQIPALRDAGYSVLVIDSRGHGRSTRDDQPYSYAQMTDDLLAVMDAREVGKAALVGWSDGAVTGLLAAMRAPERVAGLLYFACNVDPSGTKEFTFEADSPLARCFARHKIDYSELSETPEDFDAFCEAVGLMQRTQPNLTAEQLRSVAVPVTVVQSEHDEFIRPEHAEYLAATIPGAQLVLLPGVSHFAPLQRPELFNNAVLGFLKRISL
jgi:pimeloyl-ACP methyl ester carboxylesterase